MDEAKEKNAASTRGARKQQVVYLAGVDGVTKPRQVVGLVRLVLVHGRPHWTQPSGPAARRRHLISGEEPAAGGWLTALNFISLFHVNVCRRAWQPAHVGPAGGGRGPVEGEDPTPGAAAMTCSSTPTLPW